MNYKLCLKVKKKKKLNTVCILTQVCVCMHMCSIQVGFFTFKYNIHIPLTKKKKVDCGSCTKTNYTIGGGFQLHPQRGPVLKTGLGKKKANTLRCIQEHSKEAPDFHHRWEQR